MAFPPGYRRAFRYNLAVDLAAEFPPVPAEVLASVSEVAKSSKGLIKSANIPTMYLECDPVLTTGGGRYDYRSDTIVGNSEFMPTSVGVFTQPLTTPVLAKGGVYNGWTADALAAPAVCYDGSRFVMTVSFWSIANSKWASGFFISPDMQTWTYVANSLQAPTGSDYILGNSGLVWWNGKYWWGYSHYPSGGGATTTVIATSTDLLNWTIVSTPASGFDPNLCVNPSSGNLELWYMDTSRQVQMSNSPDGVTWTSHGVFLVSNGYGSQFGEPSVFYVGGIRYLTVDVGGIPGVSPSPSPTARFIALLASPAQNTIWEGSGVLEIISILLSLGNRCKCLTPA